MHTKTEFTTRAISEELVAKSETMRAPGAGPVLLRTFLALSSVISLIFVSIFLHQLFFESFLRQGHYYVPHQHVSTASAALAAVWFVISIATLNLLPKLSASSQQKNTEPMQNQQINLKNAKLHELGQVPLMEFVELWNRLFCHVGASICAGIGTESVWIGVSVFLGLAVVLGAIAKAKS